MAADREDAPLALVLRTAGTNCDREMVRAFELAGARVESVHIDRLCGEPQRLEGAGLIGFPGGFSYGDDIASGRIFAARLRERIWPALADAAARGCPMIGACNGFQVMVQLGLLPGPASGEGWDRDAAPAPVVALTENDTGRFVDRWVGIAAESASPCVWTKPLLDGFPAEAMCLPIAHGEGRFVADETVVGLLEARGQVALRYTEPVNGSAGSIAGICDASGLIFGLMPHPERYLDWTRHPFWTRLEAGGPRKDPPGLAMFRAAVAHVVRHGPIAAV